MLNPFNSNPFDALAMIFIFLAFLVGLVVYLITGGQANSDLIIGSLTLTLIDVLYRVRVTPPPAENPTNIFAADIAATNAFMEEVFGKQAPAENLPPIEPPQAEPPQDAPVLYPLWQRLLFPAFGGHVMYFPIWSFGLLSAYMFWNELPNT